MVALIDFENIDWGGRLDLQHRDTCAKASNAPIENRAAVMLAMLHDDKPTRFLDNRFRTSIAAYIICGAVAPRGG